MGDGTKKHGQRPIVDGEERAHELDRLIGTAADQRLPYGGGRRTAGQPETGPCYPQAGSGSQKCRRKPRRQLGDERGPGREPVARVVVQREQAAIEQRGAARLDDVADQSVGSGAPAENGVDPDGGGERQRQGRWLDRAARCRLQGGGEGPQRRRSRIILRRDRRVVGPPDEFDQELRAVWRRHVSERRERGCEAARERHFGDGAPWARAQRVRRAGERDDADSENVDNRKAPATGHHTPCRALFCTWREQKAKPNRGPGSIAAGPPRPAHRAAGGSQAAQAESQNAGRDAAASPPPMRWRRALGYNRRLQPVVVLPSCGSGGTGRRASLRSLLPQGSGGSNPLFRTTVKHLKLNDFVQAMM